MKVLIVCHYFLPHMGGIEQVVYHQALGLVKLGHRVTILTSRIPDNSPFPDQPDIKLIRIPAFNIFEKKFGIPFPVFSPELIWKSYFAARNCDIIHVHGHVYLTSLAACVWGKLLGKKIILTQQNTFIQHRIKLVCLVEKIFDRSVGKFTLKSANIIIAASQKTAEYTTSIIHSPDNLIVRYNGVDTDRFTPAKSKTDVRKKLRLPDKFICITIRRITFKNGIDTFLKIAENFRANPGIIFVLGGTGPDLPLVRKYISVHQLKNIRLTGFIKDADLSGYHQSGNLFILPSKKGEGFPLVILEAMSSGVPVIATKSGGHEEIIKNGINGYLTDVDDINTITDKIGYLYQNPGLLAKMSVNCRKLMEEKFSWDVNIRSLNKIYQKIISE
jgi:glycosyltransferase involved in cell wall biosynthesis